MNSSRVFSQKGWRRAGAINVGVAYTCTLVLLLCLLISVSQNESLILPTIIFEGPCTTSSAVSLFLHLLLNIVSGAILASSNFFMQVLSAPSREEINRAHAWLRSLDIGIPSIKNLWHMSWFKLISWFIFFLSSVPIHLFFNSAIFQTKYLGSEWHLTIATEAFTEGAAFFPPGASLLPAGFSLSNDIYIWPFYGYPVSLMEYWDASSIARQNLASVAREAHGWAVLNTADCQTQYISCTPRTTYRDVVVIVETGASNSAGWTRSEVFDFEPSSNLSSYWDSHVPPESINSLWFSAQCNTQRLLSNSGRDDKCKNTCLGALGGATPYYFNPKFVPPPQEPWLLSFFEDLRANNKSTLYQNHGFNDEFDNLRVRYCLAKPNQPTCKVGISNALLLVVVGCIFIKALQATIVVWKLPTASLVTPGDAIESFISDPDSRTQGLCTLDITDSERLEYGVRKRRTPSMNVPLPHMIYPRKWGKKQRRLASAITSSAWVRTYAILAPGLILLAAGLGESSAITQNNFSYSLDHTDVILAATFTLNYFGALLLVNTPQLIFSLCYFSYNSLVTRLHVEREWNSFGSDFQPLRVSYPAGEQVSSYRLQLPYTYSIPMIAISISLHWLVSNAVFLLIIEGGFVQSDAQNAAELSAIFRVSDGSFIALGYSPFFFLVLFVTSFIFIICSPVLIGLQKLKYKMVTGGCNSLVISAACYLSDLATDQQTTHEQRSCSPQQPPLDLTDNTTTLLDTRTKAIDETGQSLEMAQRKLRWGGMVLPRSLAECITTEDGEEVFHLGFGGVEDYIWEPNDNHYYA
ncbi:hypothetical protein HD806DRAFT_546783 [Xylariaceae sp. AK1471]|nr:hypothetical protein HD806DRAFT_546783 [Xylariaceae sp. AK1471]